MKLAIKTGSENYTCQVIKLPTKVAVKGFDRLVQVTHQGNNCLVSKDSSETDLHLFFPAGSVLAPEFLAKNNLYRHPELNEDKTQSGMIDDGGRVKSVKMKGVISTGLIMPLYSISVFADPSKFKVGDSFNIVEGHELCAKYKLPVKSGNINVGNKKTKVLDDIVDSKFFPEHTSTNHLLRSIDNLTLDTDIVVTIKLHGTSQRFGNQLVTKKLNLWDKIARKLGIGVITHRYAQIVGSRRALKSVDFKTLDNKNHYYPCGDLWTKVAKEFLEDKLNAGEVVYGEIIGQTYEGGAIQKGYEYGLTKPELYVYRITNINVDGIEVDLSWDQMVKRAEQLGVKTVPLFFKGTLERFIYDNLPGTGFYPFATEDNKGSLLENIFYNQLLEKPSVIDPGTPLEEGYVIRVDNYPKVSAYKIKSRGFLLLESKGQDAQTVDLEESN